MPYNTGVQPEHMTGSIRQVRGDRQTLRGALLLGGCTLGLLVVLLALAWLDGRTSGLSWPIWMLIAALGLLLLSLEVLFARDYVRIRHHAHQRAEKQG